ncbi:hypothetical protein GOP47_0001007 [Adiantum capillus-veneris]|uniref:Pentatricopeptide repeat-containing protein n=1 Tax=Adiantum capillus-veneris TaxID=13818 RepID=A0A9D4VEK9_ADICA|nr:hypothetical protein GOP47_0001007 [Adiantum capillus-veneris]
MLVARGRPGAKPRPCRFCVQVCISTLASHLRWCARFNAFQEGMAAHHHIIKNDLHRNPFLHNLLVHFYGECGALDAAEALFALCPRDVFSYNFMITAFVHAKQHNEALHFFHYMHLEAILPDRVTYAAVFSSLASLSLVEAARFLHACVLHCLNVSVATAIMHMYGKFGSLHDVQLMFRNILAPDVVAWNCALGVHVDHHKFEEALALYREMKHEGVDPDKVTFIRLLSACGVMHVSEQFHFEITCKGFDLDTVVGNALVNMYVKLSCIKSAELVFEKMPEHSVASWNTLIGAYTERNERVKVLGLFNRMQEEGFKPNKITLLNIIPACPPCDALKLFEAMNDGDVVLWNALLSSFVTDRKHGQAIQLFVQMQGEGVMPNECTFKAVMSICSSEHSLPFGKEMHVRATSLLEHSISVGNALITMYGRCFSLVHAKSTFNVLLDRNVITWTIMLTLLTQRTQFAEAVQAFDRLLLEGVLPDEFVLAGTLDACVGLISIDKGKHIHARILGMKSTVETVMGTALLSLYADCGCLRAAENIFDQIFEQTTISHNAIIIAFAHHGQAQRALSLFERMQAKDVTADSNTFLGLMTACSHCGLIEEGIFHFCLMQSTHELPWMAEHFDCVIDIFGRAGQVNASLLVIDTLHVNPTALTYRTLFSACCKSGDVICGLGAANQAFLLEPENGGCYFMLQNVICSGSFLG